MNKIQNQSPISHPLLIICKAEEIKEGNYDIGETSTSKDEIGVLTNTFNSMGKRLKETVFQIEDQKIKLETIMEYSSDGIVAFDTNGQLILINPTAKKYLNINRFRTEKEWLQMPETFVTDKRMVALTLTPENMEQFENMEFEETISYLENLDDTYYRVVPSVEECQIDVYDVNDERQCFSRRY